MRAGESSSSESNQGKEIRLKPGHRIALVHDWLNGMRGGEIVFEALLDLFPDAEVFTLIYEPENLSERLREKLFKRRVHTSFLNLLPLTRKYYRQMLPLLPFAIRSFDIYPFDLIISSSHCVAKGVKKHPHAKHLSYIHAPMRYMWDRFEDYFSVQKVGRFIRWVAQAVRPFLQAWDRYTAQSQRVDVLVANSSFIRAQIQKVYQRDAEVVFPFSELDRFLKRDLPEKRGSYYLMVGAFAPYKKTDLAIRAFADLGLPLKIVGSGQDETLLKSLAQSLHANQIEFLSGVSQQKIEELYRDCKAFVFPGKEDFGITPLEAMASGAPVIAYRAGGVCDTVTEQNGVFFEEQTLDALKQAVMEVESGRRVFSALAQRTQAQQFTRDRFQEKIKSLTLKLLS